MKSKGNFSIRLLSVDQQTNKHIYLSCRRILSFSSFSTHLWFTLSYQLEILAWKNVEICISPSRVHILSPYSPLWKLHQQVKNRLNFVLLSISRIIIIINFDQLETSYWMTIRISSCERMSHIHIEHTNMSSISQYVCVFVYESKLIWRWMRILHISRLTPPDVCTAMSYTIHYVKTDQSNWHQDYVESINKT